MQRLAWGSALVAYRMFFRDTLRSNLNLVPPNFEALHFLRKGKIRSLSITWDTTCTKKEVNKSIRLEPLCTVDGQMEPDIQFTDGGFPWCFQFDETSPRCSYHPTSHHLASWNEWDVLKNSEHVSLPKSSNYLYNCNSKVTKFKTLSEIAGSCPEFLF